MQTATHPSGKRHWYSYGHALFFYYHVVQPIPDFRQPINKFKELFAATTEGMLNQMNDRLHYLPRRGCYLLLRPLLLPGRLTLVQGRATAPTYFFAVCTGVEPVSHHRQ